MQHRRTRPGISCAILVALSAVVATAGVASARPAAAALDQNPDAGWRRPVDGTVVRPFSEPSAAFGSGHRGVDLAAPAGTPVRAAGVGTVTFAGDVAGAVDDAVTTRTIIGHTGGIDADSGHGPDTLHFGLRVGERYVDPMLLF